MSGFRLLLALVLTAGWPGACITAGEPHAAVPVPNTAATRTRLLEWSGTNEILFIKLSSPPPSKPACQVTPASPPAATSSV